MTKPGRKRLPGKRKASGDRVLSVVRDDTMAVALAQPHRLGSKDQRCESMCGRLHMAGILSDTQYEASRRYRHCVERFYAMLSAPAIARPPLVGMVSPGMESPADADHLSWINPRTEEEAFAAVRKEFDRIADAVAGYTAEQRRLLEAVACRDAPPRESEVVVVMVLLNKIARALGINIQNVPKAPRNIISTETLKRTREGDLAALAKSNPRLTPAQIVQYYDMMLGDIAHALGIEQRRRAI